MFPTRKTLPHWNHHDSFTTLKQQLAACMQTLPVTAWDWNADRYGAWVEWTWQHQLYRLEMAKDRESFLDMDSDASPLYGSEALSHILEALTHLSALAQLPFGDWGHWTSALHVTTSRRPLEPCFITLGFTERPYDPVTVRDHYRQMTKQMHPDAGGDSAAFRALKEALDIALTLVGTESSPSF